MSLRPASVFRESSFHASASVFGSLFPTRADYRSEGEVPDAPARSSAARHDQPLPRDRSAVLPPPAEGHRIFALFVTPECRHVFQPEGQDIRGRSHLFLPFSSFPSSVAAFRLTFSARQKRQRSMPPTLSARGVIVACRCAFTPCCRPERRPTQSAPPASRREGRDKRLPEARPTRQRLARDVFSAPIRHPRVPSPDQNATCPMIIALPRSPQETRLFAERHSSPSFRLSEFSPRRHSRDIRRLAELPPRLYHATRDVHPRLDSYAPASCCSSTPAFSRRRHGYQRRRPSCQQRLPPRAASSARYALPARHVYRVKEVASPDSAPIPEIKVCLQFSVFESHSSPVLPTASPRHQQARIVFQRQGTPLPGNRMSRAPTFEERLVIRHRYPPADFSHAVNSAKPGRRRTAGRS